MPLTTNYNFNNFKLYLWNINETEKELKNGVITNSVIMRLSKIKSEELKYIKQPDKNHFPAPDKESSCLLYTSDAADE